MVDYKEDPYQHVVRIRLNWRRLIQANLGDTSSGFVTISGAEPYNYVVNNFAYRIFDLGPIPTAVIFSNIIDREATDTDSLSAVVHDFTHSLSGRSLEEVIQAGDYSTDAVFTGPGEFHSIVGGNTSFPAFSGSVFTFDAAGLLTSETDPGTGVTTNYDPPI